MLQLADDAPFLIYPSLHEEPDAGILDAAVHMEQRTLLAVIGVKQGPGDDPVDREIGFSVLVFDTARRHRGRPHDQ